MPLHLVGDILVYPMVDGFEIRKSSGRRLSPNLQLYVALVRGKVEFAKIVEEIRCLTFNSPIQLVDGGETDHIFQFQ